MITWRIDAQTAAGNEDDAAKPMWIGTIPWCSPDCPHSRKVSETAQFCNVAGRYHYHGRVCEPVVKQMAALLSAGPVKP
jgi:hypothetical protein